MTDDMSRDASSPAVQSILAEIIEFSQQSLMNREMGDGYWDMIIESYENETNKGIVDQKYGAGASDYIAKALRCYFHR